MTQEAYKEMQEVAKVPRLFELMSNRGVALEVSCIVSPMHQIVP